ncbi:hypothetical protein Pmani_008162 [Petrolisthes manimaculis]|uniref:Uncharacterized protein n=1 Tax=Petrolisthes manimaculis TaxID=1843537 RepID=A0AAE1Q610_9EUCA|nr:hypothetical protein Pmani_008162 [Petrolisthes manimaculis]
MSDKQETLKEPPPPLAPLPLLGELLCAWQNDTTPPITTTFSRRDGLLENYLLVNNDERNDGELPANNNELDVDHHVNEVPEAVLRSSPELLRKDDHQLDDNYNKLDPADLAIIREKFRSNESKIPSEWDHLEDQPDPLASAASEEPAGSSYMELLSRHDIEDSERQPSPHSNKQENEDNKVTQNEDSERKPSPHSNKRQNEDDQVAQRKHRKEDSGGKH